MTGKRLGPSPSTGTRLFRVRRREIRGDLQELTAGHDPATSALQVRRSSNLSYVSERDPVPPPFRENPGYRIPHISYSRHTAAARAGAYYARRGSRTRQFDTAFKAAADTN
jgi:hypothetical protein